MYFCESSPPSRAFLQEQEFAGWEFAGLEFVVDPCSKVYIPNGGSMCSHTTIPAFSTHFHDEIPKILESDVSSRASSRSSAGPFVEDSGARPSTSQNWDVLAEVNASIESAGWGDDWLPDKIKFIQKLQDAEANHGSVDLMQLVLDGSFVAVKRMPRAWTRSGFRQKRDEDCAKHDITSSRVASENCWLDVGITKYLDKEEVPFVCQPLGVFFSASETLVVSQFATEGDLFNFASIGPVPGGERERWLCPLFKQVVDAVLWLHDRLIAHCDISMENILVTKDAETGFLQVKLIDYGLAAVGERLVVGPRGKPSYQAPEMISGAYDPFRADVFSLGVVLYSAAVIIYPWKSTKPGACKRFTCAHDQGLLELLRRHKICSHGKTTRVIETIGENLLALLHELLAMNPRLRVALRKAQTSKWLQ